MCWRETLFPHSQTRADTELLSQHTASDWLSAFAEDQRLARD